MTRLPAKIEDTLFMWGTGTSLEDIAERLGMQLASIERLFSRHGMTAPWIVPTRTRKTK